MTILFRIIRILIFSILLIIPVTIFVVGYTQTGLAISFKLANKWSNGKLSITELDGYLLGKITAEKITYTDNQATIVINNFTLDWQPLQLLRKQLIIHELQLEWQANIPELSQLVKEAQGNIVSQGHMVSQAGEITINASINSDSLQYENTKLTQTEITIKGNLDKHHLDINTQSDHHHLNIQSTGQLNYPIWTQHITSGEVSDTKEVFWKLHSASPAKLSYDFLDNHLIVDEQCWQNQQQQICLEFNSDDKQWQLKLHTKAIDSTLFNDFLPETITLTSLLTSDILLQSDTSGKLKGEFTVALAPGTLNLVSVEKLQSFTLNETTLLGQIGPKGLQAKLQIRVNENQCAMLDLNLPGLQTFDFPNDQQKINLTATTSLLDLNFIPLFIPALSQVDAQAKGSFNLSGTIAQPKIDANIIINDATAVVDEYNLSLEDIQLTAKSIDLNTLTLTSQVKSGEGYLYIKGNVNFSDTLLPDSSTFSISGENFKIMNTAEYQMLISPTLGLSTYQDKIQLNGEVLIPKANIRPLDFSQLVKLSDDVIIINEKDEKIASPSYQLSSEIKVLLGDSIYLASNGLSGNITGEITVRDEPGKPSIGNGTLNLQKGSFIIFGQKLAMDEARLTYANNAIDDPYIQAKASRQVNISTSSDLGAEQAFEQSHLGNRAPLMNNQQATVGVIISGKLDEPEIKLFAEPASIPQSDILSLLLFGRPTSQATKADAQLLVQALSALQFNNSDGSQITQQLQQKLGLDEIGIVTQTRYVPNKNDPSEEVSTTNPAIVLRKALSPKLLLSFTTGFISGSNIVNLSYQITDHWSWQTETDGTANSTDILYTIERD